jgi:hypothetical protein
MAQVWTNEGVVQFLSNALSASAPENLLLKLFKSDTTPAWTDTASTHTECDFDGYAAKTLTTTQSGSTWQTPTTASPSGSPAWTTRTLVGHAEYGTTPQVFSCTGSTGNTVYGYMIVGATSGKLYVAERFPTPRPIANGDTLSLPPFFELG